MKVGLRRSVFVSCVLGASIVFSSLAYSDGENAKKILKKMTEYVAAQKAISFDYNATLDVVTTEDQKLSLASSGTVTLNRPNKIRATRNGGFSNVEMLYDGKQLTLSGKETKVYTQVDFDGTLDQLIDELKDTHKRPLPAADLLLTNSYDELMDGVTDAKDLGSGLMNGVECDWLAFRKKEVDMQIWVARGEFPYPCRFSITSKTVKGSPQYTIQMSNWQTGSNATADDFSFKAMADAVKIDIKDLKDKLSDLPAHFKLGESQ